MLDTGLSQSTIEQVRMDLSMAAGATERANRPRMLFYGAVLLLAIAIIYALTGVTALRSSLSSVTKARKGADDIIKLTNDVKGLQETLARRGLDPNPRINVELERLAQLSGATSSGPITDTPGSNTSQAGMNQKKYSAKFSNQEATALFQFLNATLDAPETAGVEISHINLLPGGPDEVTRQARWNLDVEFTRWERQSKR